MPSRKQGNRAFKTAATCAALIAASLATPVAAQHINALERYCTSSWRQAGIPAHDWEDCTQDTMLELLNRIPQRKLADAIEQPKSPERRELMRSVWCVAQRWRRAHQRNPVSLDLLPDPGADNIDSISREEREEIQNAIDDLSSTQQQVLNQWLEGNSVAEIAENLQLPPERVSDQKYKAIRKLKKRLVPAAV